MQSGRRVNQASAPKKILMLDLSAKTPGIRSEDPSGAVCSRCDVTAATLEQSRESMKGHRWERAAGIQTLVCILSLGVCLHVKQSVWNSWPREMSFSARLYEGHVSWK